ncbi:hypothetical protein FKM82_008710 [Ascaphus truei]
MLSSTKDIAYSNPPLSFIPPCEAVWTCFRKSLSVLAMGHQSLERSKKYMRSRKNRGNSAEIASETDRIMSKHESQIHGVLENKSGVDFMMAEMNRSAIQF